MGIEMSDRLTLCLGHDVHGKPNGCERLTKCKRHTALAERDYPNEGVVIGNACIKAGYVLFVGLDEEVSK